MLDPKRRFGLAVFVKPNEDRIAFVGITAQDWFHQGTVSRRDTSALSYDHLMIRDWAQNLFNFRQKSIQTSDFRFGFIENGTVSAGLLLIPREPIST
jgi:hypothetical protein